MSVGSVPVEMEYSKGLNLVTGKIAGKSIRNGAGKSALFVDAIIFALFGKSIRGANMEDMINSINKEKCLVKLWLEINDVPYRIERGIKPGFLHIFENNKDKAKEFGNKGKTQEYLETKLCLTLTTVKNLIALNINSSKAFFKMTTSEKRTLIEDIMSLKIYGKMFEIIKSEYNDSKNNKKVIEANYKSSRSLYQDKLEIYKKAKEIQENFLKEKDEELEKLNTELENLIKEKDKIKIPTKNYDELKEKIKDTLIVKIRERIATNKQIIRDTYNTISKKEYEIDNLDSTPICPFCFNPTNTEHSEKHKEQEREEIKSLQEKLKKCKSNVEKLDKKKEEFNEKLKKINALISKQNVLKEKQQKLITKIDNLKVKISNVEEKELDISNVVTEDDVEKAKNKYLIIKKELDDENVNMVYASRMKEILGEKGIKNYIIRKILPVLNKKVNEYLSMMNASYTIRFDEQLNETIRYRNCTPLRYCSFSSGEKKRIDVAFMFTIFDIAKSRHSVDCNILILDEVLDSSVCSDGTDSFLTFLKTVFKVKYPDLCTYIITHKVTVSEDTFDALIKIKKENEFTKLEEVKQLI